MPSSSRAWISSACSGSRDSLPGDLVGQWGVHAPGLVEGGQLGHLVLGVLTELAALDVELGLDQLALRGDGGVFARRHGEGPGREPRQAGDHDGLLGDRAARDPGHQGEVRDQAVHRAEDGGAQPAAVHIPVGVIVPVRLVQDRFGLDDGHGVLLPFAPAGRHPAVPH